MARAASIIEPIKAMSDPSPAATAGFLVIFLVVILIAIGIYSANPHLLIGALVIGGINALKKKFFG